MAKTAFCPSCGAPVSFKAAASVYAVCEFCRSTLVRQDEGVKNIGRMAELLEDDTPLQLGSEGRFRNLHFAIVGRIQLKYSAGLWNEWHLLLDDGRSAWLSGAGGEYTVTMQVPVTETLPAFAALQPGAAVTLRGRPFTVTDLETARCVAGAGELPFKVDAGYDVDAADLRADGRFASIDYSETPPLVFMGEAVAYADLKLTNLRERGGQPDIGTPLAKGQVKAFACPKCGAPLAVHAQQIEVVVCDSCGVSVDAQDPNYRIIAAAAQAMRVDPLLPLGSKGKLGGSEWQTLGFMRRQVVVEGLAYPWSEYLLHNEQGEFAWLVEYNGHWSYVRSISDIPKTGASPAPIAWWQHESFKHFQSATAEVTYVVGEFYWQVKVGEQVRANDYVAPPRMLSEERGDKEITWSVGVYTEPEEVWQAFGLKGAPPPRIGVGACQPNPHSEPLRRTWRLFWKASALALLVQLGFLVFSAGATVARDTLVFRPGANEAVNTQPFVLAKPVRNLVVFQHTDLDNGWLSLDMTLVDQQSGAAIHVNRELSHYHGVDDGESWSEGDRDDSVNFGPLPPGTYYLAVDGETAADGPRIADTVQVVRDKAGWTNYVLLQIFLTLFPIAALWRRHSFETRRWADSDHAPADSGSGGGDDD
jgi:hypothetical protein